MEHQNDTKGYDISFKDKPYQELARCRYVIAFIVTCAVSHHAKQRSWNEVRISNSLFTVLELADLWS